MLLFIFFVPFPNVGIDLIKFKNIVDVFWLSDGQLTIAQDKLGDEFSEEVTEQDVWKMTGILRVGCWDVDWNDDWRYWESWGGSRTNNLDKVRDVSSTKHHGPAVAESNPAAEIRGWNSRSCHIIELINFDYTLVGQVKIYEKK